MSLLLLRDLGELAHNHAADLVVWHVIWKADCDTVWHTHIDHFDLLSRTRRRGRHCDCVTDEFTGRNALALCRVENLTLEARWQRYGNPLGMHRDKSVFSSHFDPRTFNAVSVTKFVKQEKAFNSNMLPENMKPHQCVVSGLFVVVRDGSAVFW